MSILSVAIGVGTAVVTNVATKTIEGAISGGGSSGGSSGPVKPTSLDINQAKQGTKSNQVQLKTDTKVAKTVGADSENLQGMNTDPWQNTRDWGTVMGIDKDKTDNINAEAMPF